MFPKFLVYIISRFPRPPHRLLLEHYGPYGRQLTTAEFRWAEEKKSEKEASQSLE